jgi:nucleotide-binding universal stress UspA family protein
MFNKILVALDRSEKSQFVLVEALTLAKSVDADVLLIHVVSPMEERLRSAANQVREAEESGMLLLRSRAQQALELGVKTEFSQVTGDPGRTICRVAEDWGADVIILGRRERSGLSEMLLGSMSSYILHHAPCSILTVQGKAARTEGEALQHYLDTF